MKTAPHLAAFLASPALGFFMAGFGPLLAQDKPVPPRDQTALQLHKNHLDQQIIISDSIKALADVILASKDPSVKSGAAPLLADLLKAETESHELAQEAIARASQSEKTQPAGVPGQAPFRIKPEAEWRPTPKDQQRMGVFLDLGIDPFADPETDPVKYLRAEAVATGILFVDRHPDLPGREIISAAFDSLVHLLAERTRAAAPAHQPRTPPAEAPRK